MTTPFQMGRSATPSCPRGKRRPSSRNAQIFEAVRVNGERQVDVAARHGLSQRRVSAICAQVDEYQRWAVAAPNAEELAAEQQRRNLHQGRRRAELLLVTALRQAVQSRQQLVTETRTVAGGQEVVERTVREEPIDVQWLKVARHLFQDVVRINEKIGPDAESSLAMSEVDALLAAGDAVVEGERGPVGEGEQARKARDVANYSSSSTISPRLAPRGARISPADGSVSICEETTCVETSGLHNGTAHEKEIPPDKAFYATEPVASLAETQLPQIAQTSGSNLPREVRERRARFLQSSPEPRADEMRLVRNRPR